VPRFSIWFLDLTTGETQPAFEDAAFASYAPAFSPDGLWMSYISTGDNTLNLFNLQDGSSKTLPLGFHLAIPAAWNPTGTALLFGSEAERAAWAPMHIKTYSLASGRVTDLGGPDGTTDWMAAWSPDGKWIAIDRDVKNGESESSNQVWLVRPDGTEAHVLLKEDGATYSSLNWSPDSAYLIYSRYSQGPSSTTIGRFDIYIADVRTGESRLLAENGDLASFLP
jgi:Tol biopolymer transport system component